MLTFRKPVQADITPAMNLLIEAWTPIFDGFRDQVGDELYSLFHGWEKAKTDFVAGALLGEHGLIAECDGNLAGFAHWFRLPDSDCAELGDNAVSGAMRGRGIGGQMYERVFEEMRRDGCRYVQVLTGLDPAHAPARRAYEKIGFSRSLGYRAYQARLADCIGGRDSCIRAVREEDLPRIAEIAKLAWTPIYEEYRVSHLGDELYHAFFPDAVEKKCRDVLAAIEREHGFVAEHDGQIVGCITYASDSGSKTGFIGECAVDPGMQRRGFGEKLAAFALDCMRTDGMLYAGAFTGIEKCQSAARRVCEKAGFAQFIPHVTYYRAL